MWDKSLFPQELLLHNYKCGGHFPFCATVNTHMIVKNEKKIREMFLTTLAHYQHDVIDVIWILPVWNVNIRCYLSSYDSWIYNYICNQCLSPLKLWVRTPFIARRTWYNIMWKVCYWHATCRWFSLGTPVSSTNKTDSHHIVEILLKVKLNSFSQTKANT